MQGKGEAGGGEFYLDKRREVGTGGQLRSVSHVTLELMAPESATAFPFKGGEATNKGPTWCLNLANTCTAINDRQASVTVAAPDGPLSFPLEAQALASAPGSMRSQVAGGSQ